MVRPITVEVPETGRASALLKSPKGYKQTEAGIIPEDWDSKALAELGHWKGGATPSMKNLRYWSNGTIPWVSSGDVKSSLISETPMRITEAAVRETSATLLPPNSIMIVTRSGILRKYLPVAKSMRPLAINQDIKALVPNNSAFPGYLLHLLVCFGPRILATCLKSGTTVESIEFPWLKAFQIPLPPTYAEQEAIAEALSDADALIESLEQLIAKKRQIKQAAMQELLTGKKRLPGYGDEERGRKQTEIGDIPQDWDVQPLRALCVKIQDGTHFSPVLGGDAYWYVTSQNIGFGYLDISGAQRIASAQHKEIYKRCDVKKGDLLLTKDGANTGNAALNILDEEFSLLSSVAFLRFDAREYSPAFFLYQVLSPEGQKRIKQLMSGNAITRLTLEKIRGLRFPFPGIQEQTAIVAILTDMDAEITALDSKLAKARMIKQGMMQELLTGRIRLV